MESFKAYYYGRYQGGGKGPASVGTPARRETRAPTPSGTLMERLLGISSGTPMAGPRPVRKPTQVQRIAPRSVPASPVARPKTGPKGNRPDEPLTAGRVVGRLALWVTPLGLITLSFLLLRSPVFTQDPGTPEGLRVIVGEVQASVKKADSIESAEDGKSFIKFSDIGELTDEAGNEIDLETFNPYRHPDLTGSNRLAELARKYRTHTVRSGDTLWSLARRYRVTADSILTMNKISQAHRLSPGDDLKVPTYSGVFYDVRRGDTVESIARTFGVEPETVREWNDIGSFLATGATLFLRDGKLPNHLRGAAYGVNFAMPVRGFLTSTYGMRVHPILQKPIFHTGVDIGANTGEPVLAADEGTVTFAGENGHYGKLVVIRHPSGYESAYGHLNTVSARGGQKVRRGEGIGTVGSTGLSTGPHLHFEVRYRGQFLNPQRFLTVPGAPVASR